MTKSKTDEIRQDKVDQAIDRIQRGKYERSNNEGPIMDICIERIEKVLLYG